MELKAVVEITQRLTNEARSALNSGDGDTCTGKLAELSSFLIASGPAAAAAEAPAESEVPK